MWLSNIFKKQIVNKYDPIVREMTLIGETNLINSVYVVQQSTREGINNYCVSVAKEDYRMIVYELNHLKSTDVYLYLKSRLLLEPFVENDLNKVMEICKIKLPQVNIGQYSIFME